LYSGAGLAPAPHNKFRIANAAAAAAPDFPWSGAEPSNCSSMFIARLVVAAMSMRRQRGGGGDDDGDNNSSGSNDDGGVTSEREEKKSGGGGKRSKAKANLLKCGKSKGSCDDEAYDDDDDADAFTFYGVANDADVTELATVHWHRITRAHNRAYCFGQRPNATVTVDAQTRCLL
jgi:hypothetical protein